MAVAAATVVVVVVVVTASPTARIAWLPVGSARRRRGLDARPRRVGPAAVAFRAFELGERPCLQPLQFAAIEPHAAALRTGVHDDAVALAFGEHHAGTARAVHEPPPGRASHRVRFREWRLRGASDNFMGRTVRPTAAGQHFDPWKHRFETGEPSRSRVAASHTSAPTASPAASPRRPRGRLRRRGAQRSRRHRSEGASSRRPACRVRRVRRRTGVARGRPAAALAPVPAPTVARRRARRTGTVAARAPADCGGASSREAQGAVFKALNPQNKHYTASRMDNTAVSCLLCSVRAGTLLAPQAPTDAPSA